MKKGDIVIVPFPFTDLTGTKLRPAVILIDSDQDVVVAFITSKVNRKTESAIRIRSSEVNGLKIDSFLRLDKITTLGKEIVVGRLGNLTEKEIREVDTRLIQVLK